PAQMPHAFLVGLLLGWMYYRTGSILPGVVVHWVNNTVAYAIYVLMPQTADMGLVEIFGGSRNNIILSIVFSLFILLPGIYQLNRSMKPAGKE
ncbi:MAG: CPBP family intramembrane metalloprotease, partial [Clostridiales bacterium]|nr:CPBP family intramembrane metalloprotease [Clostridiales bacterium]